MWMGGAHLPATLRNGSIQGRDLHAAARPLQGSSGKLANCKKKKNDVVEGCRLHAEILRRKGLLEKSPYLASALINMYAKWGMLSKAQEVYDTLPVHDLVSCNTLIAGYAHHGHGYEALNCYGNMYKEGISPNAITLHCLL